MRLHVFRAQLSLRPNGTALKCPCAHMALRPNALTPKCRIPEAVA